MMIPYKLQINKLLEPVKVDIKRTQTKNKTVRKYSQEKTTTTPLKIISLFRLRTAFNVSHFTLNTIRIQSNIFIRTRSCADVQVSQVGTEIIFLFMNVKRFQRSFSVASLQYFLQYTQLYRKSLGSTNLNIFFRISRVTGNRGTFIGLSEIDTRLRVDVSQFMRIIVF